jgi:hypothetical protein
MFFGILVVEVIGSLFGKKDHGPYSLILSLFVHFSINIIWILVIFVLSMVQLGTSCHLNKYDKHGVIVTDTLICSIMHCNASKENLTSLLHSDFDSCETPPSNDFDCSGTSSL